MSPAPNFIPIEFIGLRRADLSRNLVIKSFIANGDKLPISKLSPHWQAGH